MHSLYIFSIYIEPILFWNQNLFVDFLLLQLYEYIK